MSIEQIISGLSAQVGALTKAAEKREKDALAVAEKPRPGTEVLDVNGNQAPHIRKGEDPLTSRPLYMYKSAQVAAGLLKPHEAKLEIEFSDYLRKALQSVWGTNGEHSPTSVLVPLAWNLLPVDIQRDSELEVYKKGFASAVVGIDPDELLGRRAVEVYGKSQTDSYYKATMSYLTQTTGGALVAPPEFGELIPILRNKSVLNNIGAKTVPLPAQGSIQYPRQTGVTTTYQVPENTPGTESNPTFDTLTLEPKQHIGLVRTSNQLLRFAPALAEATIREDVTQQIALTFDLAGLEGAGGPNKVKGIINQTGITTVTAITTGTNGDTWQPKDIARLIRAAMTRNSDIKTWIMRPDMWLGITETRTDAVVPGDAQGNYLFNLLRMFSDDFGETLRQRKVVTSNQVSGSRSKGSATNLSYILGVDGQEILVGMHGAMAFDMNPWDSTAFAANQTVMRAILFGDVQVRRGAGVAFMDTLIIPNLDS